MLHELIDISQRVLSSELPLPDVRLLLLYSHSWAIAAPSTVCPDEVLQALARAVEWADLASFPHGDQSLWQLADAVNQLRVDIELFCERVCEDQPDGAPGPRLWASARFVASCYAKLLDLRDVDRFCPAFELRQKGHRIDIEDNDVDELDETGWKETEEFRQQVLRQYQSGASAKEIATRLRRSGRRVSTNQAAAIIGHSRKGSRGTVTS